MTIGGTTAAFFAFVAAAIAIVLLIFSLSVSVALAQEQLVELLRAETSNVKQWGGRILVVVGLWLVILGIWAEAFAKIFSV
ncbi:MAG: hypothetical protein KDE09_04085 [Anaerolineales bacterium]|nr:hypothetical protein [Anaerolineales bacterium]MCB0027313.1 hypothetical protein [Anaerolineales bacterium]